jgi:hypothetical protein
MKDGRQTVIDEVTQAVMADRNLDYAPPEDNFARIADLWTTYLGHEISPYDTAIMMVLLKVARAMHSPHLLDHLVDGAGYFACAADVMPLAPTEQLTLDDDDPPKLIEFLVEDEGPEVVRATVNGEDGRLEYTPGEDVVRWFSEESGKRNTYGFVEWERGVDAGAFTIETLPDTEIPV